MTRYINLIIKLVERLDRHPVGALSFIIILLIFVTLVLPRIAGHL